MWAINPLYHLSKLPFNICYQYHHKYFLVQILPRSIFGEGALAGIVINLNKNASDGINVHHVNIDFMKTNKNVLFLYLFWIMIMSFC